MLTGISKLIFLLIVIGCAWSISASNVDPVVCCEKGCVRGKNFQGNNKEFEGFLGIPYAEPPVGALRLKDPVPIEEKWNEILNATEEKMYCMQKNYLLPNPTVSGVEDCLYLYVYRPKNLARRRRLLPVIFYIHGGGFFAGTAGPSITGADYFMDSGDVLFVTMNYRLGPLGFLSTGDSSMPGNFGLKDQALAMKWVKENIEAFGGDAKNIVLMGQSAGGSSAHLHMMSSPKWSRNLFHKVVAMSGNGNGPYAYVIKDPLQQARQFARAIKVENFAVLKPVVLAEKLRNADAADLINACDSLKIWSVDSMTISRPVVEDCRLHDGFLCEDPVISWRNGNFVKVPILTGFMDGDGGVRALAIIENKTQLNDLNERFDELMPKIMEIDDASVEVIANRLEKIKKRYFRGLSEIRREDYHDLIRLYTERSFITPLYNTLQQLVTQDRKAHAYLYKFSFDGSLSYAPFYTGNYGSSNIYGPVHCDELIYLLKSPMLFPVEIQSREANFRSKFVKFFTDFAAFGKPSKIMGKTIPKCESSDPKSINSSLKCNYVEFCDDSTIKISGEIDASIAAFWNDIDPKMVGGRSFSTSQIEVTQILKKGSMR